MSAPRSRFPQKCLDTHVLAVVTYSQVVRRPSRAFWEDRRAMAFTHDHMEVLLRTSAFQTGSVNRAVVEVLSDGQWHSKAELAEKCGARLNNINYVVNRLRDEFEAHVIRGNIPPEEGRFGGDGVKWAIIFDNAPAGPAIKNVATDDQCIEFTKSGRKYAIRSTEGGLYITGPGVELLV